MADLRGGGAIRPPLEALGIIGAGQRAVERPAPAVLGPLPLRLATEVVAVVFLDDLVAVDHDCVDLIRDLLEPREVGRVKDVAASTLALGGPEVPALVGGPGPLDVAVVVQRDRALGDLQGGGSSS